MAKKLTKPKAPTFLQVPVECCGENRTTPFCPQCGSRLTLNPAHILCIKIVKALDTYARAYDKSGDEYGLPTEDEQAKVEMIGLVYNLLKENL